MKNSTKTQSAITTSVEHTALLLTFADGRQLLLDAGRLSSEIKEAAMMHGLKQKLVDAAAISRDPTTGRAATIDTKYEAVREVFDRITGENPQWNKTREGGGATGGLLLQALVRMYAGKQTKERIVDYLAGLDDKQKAALRKNSRVATIIEEIRAERGGDSADSDELLAELED